MTKYNINLSNPILFWIVVITVTVAFLVMNTRFEFSQINESNKKHTVIEQQSLSQNDTQYTIDLDKIESAKQYEDLVVKDFEELSFSKQVESVVSENIFTLIYSILISILFIFREKQNRDKIYKFEKLEDELNMQVANQKTAIYADITKELGQFSEIIKHDINLEVLNERIQSEPKYVVIAAKNILEQIITKMHQKYQNLDNANLNIMLMNLYKSRKLGHEANNYAHIIKAFGNKANHTNKIFDSREASLVLSNLIEFLKYLNNQKILLDLDND